MPKTDTFHPLYVTVTSQLHAYVGSRDDWSSAESAWFMDLIEAFQRKYDEWSTTPFSQIQQYLELFDAKEVGREVRLAGHVFLHIAFDLPRAIAETPPPDVSPARLGQLFLAPSPLFPKIFIAFARSGGLGILGRLLGRVHAARILAFWVLALRAQGWIHAGMLSEHRTSGVAMFEQRQRMMAQAMRRAAAGALQRGSVSGISDLNNAELLPGASPFITAQFSSPPLIAGAVTAMAAALAGYRLWRHRRDTVNQIEVLGAFVHSAMHRALRGEFGEDHEPGPGRREATNR